MQMAGLSNNRILNDRVSTGIEKLVSLRTAVRFDDFLFWFTLICKDNVLFMCFILNTYTFLSPFPHLQVVLGIDTYCLISICLDFHVS